MREILFRGICKETGKFEYGYAFDISGRDGAEPRIMHFDHEDWELETEVHPETVGQYTGLKDKNGTKIFEGDRIRCNNGHIGVVEYEVNGFVVTDFCDTSQDIPWCAFSESSAQLGEVIGNIHE